MAPRLDRRSLFRFGLSAAAVKVLDLPALPAVAAERSDLELLRDEHAKLHEIARRMDGYRICRGDCDTVSVYLGEKPAEGEHDTRFFVSSFPELVSAMGLDTSEQLRVVRVLREIAEDRYGRWDLVD